MLSTKLVDGSVTKGEEDISDHGQDSAQLTTHIELHS